MANKDWRRFWKCEWEAMTVSHSFSRLTVKFKLLDEKLVADFDTSQIDATKWELGKLCQQAMTLAIEHFGEEALGLSGDVNVTPTFKRK